MKKYAPYIIAITLVIVSITLFIWLRRESNEQWHSSEIVAVTDRQEASVERYGVLQRSSTSGDMRFNYYDIQQKKVLDNFEGHPWFFALKDESMTDEYLQYLQENKGAVFKIVGKKLSDDCDYYEDGSCLEDIAVEKIEVAR